jgi:hypothetical protein
MDTRPWKQPSSTWSSFIRQNCVGCTHHEEISPNNFGRDVIAAKERHETEAKTADDRRKQLKAQTYEAAANALNSGEPTEESVNRFIVDLFGGDDEAERSKDLLKPKGHALRRRPYQVGGSSRFPNPFAAKWFGAPS